jgi:photosystem I subunit 3
MARSGAVLLCAVGAAVLLAAAVAFVGSPAGPHGGAPRLRSADIASQALPKGLSETPVDGAEPATEQSAMASFFKWLSAGLLAGVVMAVSSSAPVQAKPVALPGGFQTQFEPSNYTIKKSKILEPCKNNKKFKKNISNEIYKVQNQQKKYAEGSAVYARFTKKIALVKQREEAYGDRFCGKKDGWPRTIATGEFDVRGSVVWPAMIFLYTAGWIGWTGREYLIRTGDEMKELNIDVPLALTCMASGFSWPVSAWQDIVNGDFVVPENQVNNGGPY